MALQLEESKNLAAEKSVMLLTFEY